MCQITSRSVKMVLDAPLRDELRKSGLVTQKVGIMEISDNAHKAALRDTLMQRVSDGLSMAFAASRALVHLRSDSPSDPDILGETNMYDKATEQAIALIHDTMDLSTIPDDVNTSELPDDNGYAVSNHLQTALMIAVFLKSDIFDKVDDRRTVVEPDNTPEPDTSETSPHHRLARHIVAVFADLPYGAFRTIAQIRDAITPVYPNQDERPGSGALVTRLAHVRKPIKSADGLYYVAPAYKDGNGTLGGRKVLD